MNCQHCAANIDHRHPRARLCFPCSTLKRYRDGRKATWRVGRAPKVNGKRVCFVCRAVPPERRFSTCVQCGDAYRGAHARSGKDKAGSIVAGAIRRGLLAHPSTNPCVDCGGPATEYDHRDYAKPLDVQPVCRRCNLLRGPGFWLDRAEQERWAMFFPHLFDTANAVPAERAAA